MSPRSGAIVFAVTLLLLALLTAVSFAASVFKVTLSCLSLPCVTLGDRVSSETLGHPRMSRRSCARSVPGA